MLVCTRLGKKIIALVLICSLFMSLTVIYSKAEDSQISPRLTYISDVYGSCVIVDSCYIKYGARILLYSTSNTAEVTINLAKKQGNNWPVVDSFVFNIGAYTTKTDEFKTVIRYANGTYKATAIVRILNSNGTCIETHSGSSVEVVLNYW